jgi:hypothetical protein
MDRAEAAAIYDAGREACVQFILDLAGRLQQHEDRLKRLEEQARQTRGRVLSHRRVICRRRGRSGGRKARAKAEELMREEDERRERGGQPGHRGAGRELKPSDQMDQIVDHYPDACGACGVRFLATSSSARVVGSVATRSLSYRRSA